MASWEWLAAILACIFILDRLRSKKSEWPSPPRLPLLGSLHIFEPLQMAPWMMKWGRKLGPIYSFKLGTGDEALVVTDATLAKELFVDNSAKFDNRARPWFYAEDLEVSHHWIPGMDSTPWVLLQRQLIHHANRVATVRLPGGSLDRSTRDLIGKFNTKEGVDNFYSVLGSAAHVISLTLAYGLKLGMKDIEGIPKVQAMSSALRAYMQALDMAGEPSLAFPFLQYALPWRSARLRVESRKVSRGLLKSYIDLYSYCMEVIERDGTDALEPSIMKTLLEGKGAGMTEDEQTRLTGVMVAASSTTVTSTIFACIACLAAVPEWQKRLQVQVDAYVAEDKEGSGEALPSDVPTMEKEMPELFAFYNEAERHYPIFPINNRVAINDYTLPDGRVIKSGTLLYFVHLAINMDPKMHDNPEAFDPMRFMKKKDTSGRIAWPRWNHATFGGGRRVCPGADYAQHTLAYFLARLIYCYDFSFEDGSVGLQNLKPHQEGFEAPVTTPKLRVTPRRDIEKVLAA